MITAWDIYFFRSRLGLRERVGGLTYERTLEYPWVCNRLAPAPGMKILDLGSSKSIFPLFAGWKHDVTVTMADMDPLLAVQRKYIRRLGLDPARFNLCLADGTALPFSDGAFDIVTAISSVEHIPGDGDSAAAAEMGRALRPGGRLLMTVPMLFEYREEFKSGTFYGRPDDGKAQFFGRLYNREELQRRIVAPSGLSLQRLEIYGHPGFDFGRFWWLRAPEILKVPFRWMTPVFSSMFLKPVDDMTPETGACTGCVELVKTD